MELSPGQQKALFAVVVVVLAGLGIFLISSRGHGSNSPSAAGSASTSAAPTAPGSAGPTTAPAPAPTGSASVNIYQWLPFTQQDLAQASAVTTQFAIDYNTFSYHQNAASYVAKMSNLITPQLSQKLQGSYSTLSVAQARNSQKQISTGTASIDSLRTFGASSITFVVTATQKLNSTKGNSTNSTQYAITVTGTGGSWQVFDIELASVGNQ
jgi:hypothetical protein